MINVEKEKLVPIREATRVLPAGSRHLSSLYRWLGAGLNGVVLDSVKIGGRRFTSCEAINRFIRQVTTASPLSRDRDEISPFDCLEDLSRESSCQAVTAAPGTQ